MKKNHLKTFLLYAVLIVAVILTVSIMFSSNEAEKPKYSDVIDYFQNDQVIEFTIDKKYYLTMVIDELDAEGKPLGKTKTVGYQLRSLDLFNRDCSEYYLAENSVSNLKTYEIEPESVVPWWI